MDGKHLRLQAQMLWEHPKSRCHACMSRCFEDVPESRCYACMSRCLFGHLNAHANEKTEGFRVFCRSIAHSKIGYEIAGERRNSNYCLTGLDDS